jgi:hypothetical protein
MSLTPEEIESNFNKVCSLCEKLGDRTKPALAMLEHLGERLALCPASSKKDFHNSFPGGLLDHSLRVLGNAMTLSRAYEWKIPRDSLIIGCLFHDLGKVGDVDNDFYVAAEEWKQKKWDELYDVNKNMQHMSVPHRSVFLCQHFGLKLTQEEFLAIVLNDGWVDLTNKEYCLKEPLLAHVVMTADYISTMQEKNLFP